MLRRAITRLSKPHLPIESTANNLVDIASVAAVTSYEERKPFVSQRSIKSFTTYILVGASCFGAVYMLLSKVVANDYDAEAQVVSEILQKEKTIQAVVVEAPALPEFRAPSSYADLMAKMADDAQSKQPGAAANNAIAQPLLHQQMLFRAKLSWNNAVANVQLALDRFAQQWQERRERLAIENAKALIGSMGYEVVALKDVSSGASS